MTSPSPSSPPLQRVRIYQLLPRLFGNVNETRQPNGTLAENGCGRFSDLNEAALEAISAMGFTHLWLTGVLRPDPCQPQCKLSQGQTVGVCWAASWYQADRSQGPDHRAA